MPNKTHPKYLWTEKRKKCYFFSYNQGMDINSVEEHERRHYVYEQNLSATRIAVWAIILAASSVITTLGFYIIDRYYPPQQEPTILVIPEQKPDQPSDPKKPPIVEQSHRSNPDPVPSEKYAE